MSATIGIQLITASTGTSQGHSQQQAEDNSAKGTADAQAKTAVDASDAPPRPPPVSTSQHVDRVV